MNSSIHSIESDVIRSLKLGDKSAFETVFEAHYHKLYVFCFRLLKDQTLAEGIVQDSFLNLWLNREKLNEEQPIEPYLYTIARRLTLNSLRHISTVNSVHYKLRDRLPKMHNETEEVIFLNDLERFTEEALAKLSPQQQLVFRMSRYDNLSYIEIAEKLEISKNTVKNHLVAALRILRQHFDQSGILYLLQIAIYLF